MKVTLLGPHPVDLARADGGSPAALAGGVDAVVVALARGLAQRPGIEVSLVTAVPDLTQPARLEGDGYPVYCVPRPRRGRATGQAAVVGYVRDQVRSLAPDVVHAHIAGIYARAALASGRPAVVTLHGIIWREMEQAWAATSWGARLRWLSDALVERRVVRRAPEIIAISPYVLDEFKARTRARFHVIENPVADRFFATSPAPAHTQRLLCVARVIPRKGILALVTAFGQIAAACPAATLAIAGDLTSDPAYVSACRAAAEQLGIAARIEFLGALDSAALQAQLAAANLCVLASEQETAPVSIAEAMAAGRPVVTTDVGGCAAMVADGVTGLVTAPRDPRAFAAAVTGLLADPARLARLGSAARVAAENRWRLGSIVDATLAIYRQLGASA